MLELYFSDNDFSIFRQKHLYVNNLYPIFYKLDDGVEWKKYSWKNITNNEPST